MDVVMARSRFKKRGSRRSKGKIRLIRGGRRL